MQNEEPPPELTDSQLLAYLENSAEPNVVKEIEQSIKYRQRARQLAQEQNGLVEKLFRTDCPDTIELGEYFLGYLVGEGEQKVVNHLTRCPYCNRELAIYQEFLANDLPQQTFLTKVKIMIARLLPSNPLNIHLSSSPLPLQPVRLATRGSNNNQEQPRIYTADDDVEIILNVFPSANNRKSLKGLIIGLPKEPIEIHLWQDDVLVDSSFFDHVQEKPTEDGQNFSFDNLRDGTYELLVKGNQLLVHIQSFVV